MPKISGFTVLHYQASSIIKYSFFALSQTGYYDEEPQSVKTVEGLNTFNIKVICIAFITYI